MDITTVQNSVGLWICAAIMVAIILVQAVLFLRASKKEADRLNIPKEKQKDAMRSSAITSIGPSLALSIMLITLMTLLGGPTAWMRLNDVGSGRTELAIANMVKGLVTAPKGTAAWNLQNFSDAIWAQGIDVVGWILGAMITVVLGSKITEKMNSKFDEKWIKVLMAGCLISLFAYLLTSSVYGQPSPYLAAAVFGGLTMLVVNKVFGKNKRLQDWSLGIAILVGAALAQIIA